MGALDTLLSRLHKVQRIGTDRWKACCPAHDDKSPSLAIRDDGGKILLHCFAECENSNVVAAVGMSLSDLMPEQAIGHHIPKQRRPFYPGDVLNIISFEALLVYLCAADMANGKTLGEKELNRLLLAVSRIKHACEVANGY